jgi:hypothetical protein
VSDSRGSQDNQLELWGDTPRWEYSTAPLMDWDTGSALAPPDPGSRGHALHLNDQQVHILPLRGKHQAGCSCCRMPSCRVHARASCGSGTTTLLTQFCTFDSPCRPSWQAVSFGLILSGKIYRSVLCDIFIQYYGHVVTVSSMHGTPGADADGLQGLAARRDHG